jgi:hypothetical protein
MSKRRSNYTCVCCGAGFDSHQALVDHRRASHPSSFGPTSRYEIGESGRDTHALRGARKACGCDTSGSFSLLAHIFGGYKGSSWYSMGKGIRHVCVAESTRVVGSPDLTNRSSQNATRRMFRFQITKSLSLRATRALGSGGSAPSR